MNYLTEAKDRLTEVNDYTGTDIVIAYAMVAQAEAQERQAAAMERQANAMERMADALHLEVVTLGQ